MNELAGVVILLNAVYLCQIMKSLKYLTLLNLSSFQPDGNCFRIQGTFRNLLSFA